MSATEHVLKTCNLFGTRVTELELSNHDEVHAAWVLQHMGFKKHAASLPHHDMQLPAPDSDAPQLATAVERVCRVSKS